MGELCIVIWSRNRVVGSDPVLAAASRCHSIACENSSARPTIVETHNRGAGDIRDNVAEAELERRGGLDRVWIPMAYARSLNRAHFHYASPCTHPIGTVQDDCDEDSQRLLSAALTCAVGAVGLRKRVQVVSEAVYDVAIKPTGGIYMPSCAGLFFPSRELEGKRKRERASQQKRVRAHRIFRQSNGSLVILTCKPTTTRLQKQLAALRRLSRARARAREHSLQLLEESAASSTCLLLRLNDKARSESNNTDGSTTSRISYSMRAKQPAEQL